MHRTVARLGAALLGLRLIRNFGALTAAQIFGRGIRFLYLVVVARLLGPESVGIYAYGFAVGLALLGVAGFGQAIYLSTRLGKSRAGVSRVVSHSFTVVFVMSAVATALGLTVVWATENKIGMAQAVTFFVLAVGPRALVLWVHHCYVALEQADWIPRYEVTFRGGEAVAGTVALLLGAGLSAVCAIHFLSWALEAAFTLRRLVREDGLSLTLGRNLNLLKGILSTSFYFMASLALLNLFSQIGVLGLRLLQPEAAAIGCFGIANQIIMVVLLIPLMFGQVFLPSLSRGYHRIGRGAPALTLVVKIFWLVGGMSAIFVHSYGGWIITTLFGDRFAPAVPVLATICWVLGPYSVTLLLVQALNGVGGRGMAAVTALTMVAAHVLLMALLMPFGAMTAAASALLIAASLGALLAVVFVHLRLGIEGHDWWLHPLVAVIGPGAIVLSGVLPDHWNGPAAAVLLVLLVWLLKVFRAADLDLIRGRLHSVTG